MKSYDGLVFRNKHIMIDLGTGNNNKMYVVAFSVPEYCSLTLLRICSDIDQ